MPSSRITIAVDIGGTFTDLEFRDSSTGAAHSLKSPTTPDNPARGLTDAIALAGARFGFTTADIGLILHGTTIATNAVLTRDLPAGALITTEGFEDVLEIGRHARSDIYALRGPDRSILVPRRHRFGAPGRIAASGEVVREIDMTALDAMIDRVAASGAKATAICLLNAYANPTQEITIRDRLLARCPDMAVSCSHEVSPEIREFERTATTVLNALLVPVIARYVTALRARLTEAQIAAPVYLIQSNGGAISLDAAVQAPVKLLLSGPSGGVLAAQKLANTLKTPDVVGVDMGGTSYDVAVVAGGERTVVTQGEIDGLPVRVPMVEMNTIGAGGGSIAFVDPSGRLQVGPRSAGAVPGPVCYNRGGTEPTVTDVNLILGRLDPATFLGGRFALDLDGARAALRDRIEQPLSLTPDHAAAGILAVVNAKLAASIKFSLFAKGLDPRDFALMSFGGAGGLHAIEVAEELGITRVIFPRDPSTFSAHGILFSDIQHDLSRTEILPLASESLPALNAMADDLRTRGSALLDQDKMPEDKRILTLTADLRYRGQAFELMTAVPDGPLSVDTLAILRARFEDQHRQRFSFDDPKEAVELVTLRLTAIGVLGDTNLPAVAYAPSETAPVTRRPVHVDGAWFDTPVHRQLSLAPGTTVTGPAIIEQEYTTLLIPGRWTLTMAATGDMTARKQP
ncbi:hydantoinase/oxoprolinase family protein [Hoeflea ulvae]|uniref:Hydantoinase/oxoprolinase family protein n=1 Tax=Hoeflea ulvae TaxID=2983764 RepID=A0ABT3YAW5_9HYPH|nr:hydantoinase/oxoprolinase family protein [Hoeflea ulvae]MCY0093018.1 hydantoinase/oxoprolinase family protein [Hoeflea ulvae]